MKNPILLTMAMLCLVACGDEEDDAPPPPPTTVNQPPTTATGQPPAVANQPPGQVMVSVIANSSPPGAHVLGGGQDLGVTPLQTQVPIIAPPPGQAPPAFDFTFTLPGYQPATIQATPVNNTISITAALAPLQAPPTPVGVGSDESGGGNEISVQGRGGGPIRDQRTTSSNINVGDRCVIQRLRVRIRGNHSFYGDLIVRLRSPSGRTFTLKNQGRSNPFRTHRVRRAAGQQAQGRWTLSIQDVLNADTGRFTGWSMNMTCR